MSEDNVIFDFMVGERRTKILQEYSNQHCCCPACGSKRNTQTLMGCTLDLNKPDEYMDENHVICKDCGWTGIVHDLKPDKESENE